MDTLLKIGFIVIALVIVYKLIFSSAKGITLFEMHFKEGRLISHKGKIPGKFEYECRHLAKSEKLTAVIRAEKSGRVRLHISLNVSKDLTQRIRNQFPFEYYDSKSVDKTRLVG